MKKEKRLMNEKKRERYSSRLGSRRLRVASVLPARLAMATLDRVEWADWENLRRRVRVPRWRVYQNLAAAFLTGR